MDGARRGEPASPWDVGGLSDVIKSVESFSGGMCGLQAFSGSEGKCEAAVLGGLGVSSGTRGEACEVSISHSIAGSVCHIGGQKQVASCPCLARGRGSEQP